jgi:hypothetical protein
MSGGCQCGAVRYRLLCAPTHASICHCRMCQKASGQPVMAFARVPKDKLQWTRGTPGVFRSSNLVERHFCSVCGTPLTYNFIEGSNISVTMCSLDDPENARPELQYSVDMQVSWFAGMHALPSKRTEESLKSRMVSYQHPDHET